MTDSLGMDELSEAEKQMLDSLRTFWGTDYDRGKVLRHLSAYRRGNESLNLAEFPHMEPEKKAAAQIAPFPEDINDSPSKLTKARLAKPLISAAHVQIASGIDLVKWLDSYVVFQPSIEKILNLDRDESQAAFKLFLDFTASDYGSALNQSREPFLMTLRGWEPDTETTESISEGLEIYREALAVFERGFPLLLGLKRILDGENPDISDLQKRRASSVRAELTDTQDHPNSVYFDLVVDQYDRTLRNAIAHGDIVHDPTKPQVKVPNENSAYTYAEFNEVAKKNFANGVFLTGLCQSLVEWRAYMYANDSVTREVIPV